MHRQRHGVVDHDARGGEDHLRHRGAVDQRVRPSLKGGVASLRHALGICIFASRLYTCRMSDDRQVFRATPTGNGDLALSGELDALTVPDLNEVLSARNGARHVTLDLSELTFIDSTGLHAIVAYVRSREPDGTVTLTGASPHIVRVLEITRLTDLPKLRIDGAA